MLELRDDLGLAMVTMGKKILSWLYSKLTSLPLEQIRVLKPYQGICSRPPENLSHKGTALPEHMGGDVQSSKQ